MTKWELKAVFYCFTCGKTITPDATEESRKIALNHVGEYDYPESPHDVMSIMKFED